MDEYPLFKIKRPNNVDIRGVSIALGCEKLTLSLLMWESGII